MSTGDFNDCSLTTSTGNGILGDITTGTTTSDITVTGNVFLTGDMYQRSNKASNKMELIHDVEIEVVDNGFLVNMGDNTLVFSDLESLDKWLTENFKSLESAKKLLRKSKDMTKQQQDILDAFKKVELPTLPTIPGVPMPSTPPTQPWTEPYKQPYNPQPWDTTRIGDVPRDEWTCTADTADTQITPETLKTYANTTATASHGILDKLFFNKKKVKKS